MIVYYKKAKLQSYQTSSNKNIIKNQGFPKHQTKDLPQNLSSDTISIAKTPTSCERAEFV